MSRVERTRSIKSRVIAKAPWLCDGCGRWRPAGSSKYVITEGTAIVGQLCVFCRTKPEMPGSVEADAEAAQAGGIEDPFEDEKPEVVNVWEEVFGGCAELAELEAVGERTRGFDRLSRSEIDAGFSLLSPFPHR